MDNLAATILYLVYLGGVGALVLFAWGWTRNFFINAFALSVSILVLSQVVLRSLGTSVVFWYWAIHLVILLLIVSGLVLRTQIRAAGNWGWREVNFQAVWPVGLIIFSVATYHLWVGPYTEIPSDYWARLNDVAAQLAVIDVGIFPRETRVGDLFDDKLYVPFLHATVSSQLDILPIWLTSSATLVSTCLFLLATYCFAMRVGIEGDRTKAQIRITALLATLLTCLAVGVSSFSYVRYYAYFPHIINATLLYATLLHFLDFLDREEGPSMRLFLCAMFLITMALINKQEALMACILIVGLSVWRFGRHSLYRLATSLKLIRRAQMAAVVAVVGTGLLIFFTLVTREPGPWIAPHLIDLGKLWEPLRGLLVANPTMRTLDALGFFGLLTYLWFFCERKMFQGRDYIWVSMLVPILTLFNPLFVYWFLHVASWDPLWRLALISPIALVAANLITCVSRRFCIDSGSLRLNARRVTAFALLVALSPFAFGEFSNRFSRVPGLMPVDRTAGAGLYRDLINFLDQQEPGIRIRTDYVTNYVLTSAVAVQGRRSAKASWQLKRSDLDGDYRDKLLYYKADDSLIIVNHRNGPLSWTGRASKHWPEDILQVRTIYPDGLEQFLNERKSDFKKIWQQGEIAIYRVLRNPEHY